MTEREITLYLSLGVIALGVGILSGPGVGLVVAGVSSLTLTFLIMLYRSFS